MLQNLAFGLNFNNDYEAGVFWFLVVIYYIYAPLQTLSWIFLIPSAIHIMKNHDVHNRTLWLILSIFIPTASIIYFFGPRRKYNKNKKNLAGHGATAATGGQAQAPGGQPIDPATAATATGAGVGVAASQVGDSGQAAPDAQPQEPPAPPEPAEPQAPEETQEPSADSQENTDQSPEGTTAQEDDSLQQPDTETENPDQQEADEEDKNQSGDSAPPADPGPMSGPSI